MVRSERGKLDAMEHRMNRDPRGKGAAGAPGAPVAQPVAQEAMAPAAGSRHGARGGRRGGVDPISAGLRQLLDTVSQEPVPDEFLRLLDRLDENVQRAASGGTGSPRAASSGSASSGSMGKPA